MRRISLLLILALAGCASAPPLAGAQTLTTDTYRLTLWSHCQEGEVSCDQLTALLVNQHNGQATTLTGSTEMVKCADHVTPCHIGFYALSSAHLKLRAYPDGSLEFELPAAHPPVKPGTWSH